MSAKIFGIGLGKTGTSSLNRALEILGYRSVHNPWNALRMLRLWRGDFHFPELDQVDAVTEMVSVVYLGQFDRMYPGSKFILPIRDMDDWLCSVERWFSEATGLPRFRVSQFGCLRFCREHFIDVYRRHERMVGEYFRGRERDLLTMSICDGDGWDRLCPFLDKPVPDKPFPWMNKTVDLKAHAAKELRLPRRSSSRLVDPLAVKQNRRVAVKQNSRELPVARTIPIRRRREGMCSCSDG